MSIDITSLATIPEFPEYGITVDGAVYTLPVGDYVPLVDDDHVRIRDRIMKIDTLLALAYIGNVPFPLVMAHPENVRPSGRYHRITRAALLDYYVSSISPSSTDALEFMLDGVAFRFVPKTRERYVCSRNGVIYDLTRQRFVHRTWSQGYPHVSLAYETGGAAQKSVHVIVYRTFIGDIPKGMQVDHIDNRRYNPHVDNLQLLSNLDNTRKSRYEGARVTPYTFEQMDEVCRMISENYPNSAIAEYLGLPYVTRSDKQTVIKLVWKLKHREGYYDDLKQKYDMSNYDISVNYGWNRLTVRQVDEIKCRLMLREKGRALATEFGVSPATISHIRTSTRDGSRTIGVKKKNDRN